jgi:hypothetical protein
LRFGVNTQELKNSKVIFININDVNINNNKQKMAGYLARFMAFMAIISVTEAIICIVSLIFGCLLLN